MTHNQIEYWKLQEDKRHNLTSEGETERHNVVTENIGIGTLAENSRHNKTLENETLRHNVMVENETKRSNYARENETRRSNLANEYIKAANLTEYRRSNKANEDLRSQEIDVKSRDVKVKEDLLPSQIASNWSKALGDTSDGLSTMSSTFLKSSVLGAAVVPQLGKAAAKATKVLIPTIASQHANIAKLGTNIAKVGHKISPTIKSQKENIKKIGNDISSKASEVVTAVGTLAKTGLSETSFFLPMNLDFYQKLMHPEQKVY